MTINKFLLNELRKYRGVYIETGLSKGDSLHSASKLNFTKLISIEINKPYIQDAKIRFAAEIANNRIEIIEGDSSLIIDDVIKKNKENIDVIYLDAHFHGEGSTYAPLDKELDCIIYHKIRPLIIIDDFFHIKKKIANSWTKYHDEKNIKNKLIKITGEFTELPYSFKYRYNSYLVSKKIKLSIVLFYTIRSFLITLPKNILNFFLLRKLN